VGTMIKRFQGGGWPAHNGVLASLLALKGLTAPSTILEGERGVCRAFGIEKEPQIEKLTEDLGKNYMIMQREIKPYATGGMLQASVEAAIEMKTIHKVKPDEIEEIGIGCSFKLYDTHTEKKPRSLMAGQYSLPFTTALAFFCDLSDPSVWNDQVVNRPEVLALAQKMDMRVDEELDKICKETNDYGGTKMKVRLKDGREIKTWIRYAKGSYGNPATSEDIHRKFNVVAGSVFPQEKVQKLAQVVDRLEELKSPASLSRALMQLSSE
jgi:2-methylcitrate dehydratase PrpD